MGNDFKDVLPEGLASYSDHINEDEHYQNDFKVINFYFYFRLRFSSIFIKDKHVGGIFSLNSKLYLYTRNLQIQCLNQVSFFQFKFGVLSQRERDYYSTNLSKLNIHCLKPVLKCKKPQNNTRNHDAIQVINPTIFRLF